MNNLESVVPNNRPKRPVWVEDGSVYECFDCKVKFGSTKRKHHCRKCGLLFCSSCCSKSCLIPREQQLPGYQSRGETLYVPQKVCNVCFQTLLPVQEDIKRLFSQSSKEVLIDRNNYERYITLPTTTAFSGLSGAKVMEQDIAHSVYTLYNFTSDNAIEGRDRIPKALIRKARGIVFLTVIKAGFIVSGRYGSGIVIVRLPDGSWSAPSALSVSGIGWGIQLGGEIMNVILILRTRGAVKAFESRAQVSLGTGLSVSVGPVGRAADAELQMSAKGAAAVYSYAHCKGIFAGVSLEASVISTRSEINRLFYGDENVTNSLLFSGVIPRPKAADALYSAIKEVLGKSDKNKALRKRSRRRNAINRMKELQKRYLAQLKSSIPVKKINEPVQQNSGKPLKRLTALFWADKTEDKSKSSSGTPRPRAESNESEHPEDLVGEGVDYIVDHHHYPSDDIDTAFFSNEVQDILAREDSERKLWKVYPIPLPVFLPLDLRAAPPFYTSWSVPETQIKRSAEISDIVQAISTTPLDTWMLTSYMRRRVSKRHKIVAAVVKNMNESDSDISEPLSEPNSDVLDEEIAPNEAVSVSPIPGEDISRGSMFTPSHSETAADLDSSPLGVLNETTVKQMQDSTPLASPRLVKVDVDIPAGEVSSVHSPSLIERFQVRRAKFATKRSNFFSNLFGKVENENSPAPEVSPEAPVPESLLELPPVAMNVDNESIEGLSIDNDTAMVSVISESSCSENEESGEKPVVEDEVAEEDDVATDLLEFRRKILSGRRLGMRLKSVGRASVSDGLGLNMNAVEMMDLSKSDKLDLVGGDHNSVSHCKRVYRYWRNNVRLGVFGHGTGRLQISFGSSWISCRTGVGIGTAVRSPSIVDSSSFQNTKSVMEQLMDAGYSAGDVALNQIRQISVHDETNLNHVVFSRGAVEDLCGATGNEDIDKVSIDSITAGEKLEMLDALSGEMPEGGESFSLSIGSKSVDNNPVKTRRKSIFSFFSNKDDAEEQITSWRAVPVEGLNPYRIKPITLVCIDEKVVFVGTLWEYFSSLGNRVKHQNSDDDDEEEEFISCTLFV